MHLNTYLSLIIVLLLIITIYYYIPLSDYSKLNKYGSNYSYNVISSFDNNKLAVDIIDGVNNKILRFLEFLQDKYEISMIDEDISKTYENSDIINIVKNILINYNPEKIYETDPRITDDTSYVVNKGDYMYMCVRQKNNPLELVDENVLLFVILHEISHIGAYDTTDHSERFWEVFKFILENAVEAKIYNAVDYELKPIDYCGLHINYNPLFDAQIKNISSGANSI